MNTLTVCLAAADAIDLTDTSLPRLLHPSRIDRYQPPVHRVLRERVGPLYSRWQDALRGFLGEDSGAPAEDSWLAGFEKVARLVVVLSRGRLVPVLSLIHNVK